jgi:hypothetical protein
MRLKYKGASPKAEKQVIKIYGKQTQELWLQTFSSERYLALEKTVWDINGKLEKGLQLIPEKKE